MSKDPAFLFYPGDYLGGTMGFSLEQHGAYLIVLIFQFNNGPFKESDAVKLTGQEAWNSISSKFKKNTHGLFFNERMQIEITKRQQHVNRQRENAMKRWGKTNKPLSKTKLALMPWHCDGNAMAMPLEDRNRNEDKKGSGETKTWRTDLQIYLAEAEKEFDKLMQDWEWVALMRRYHPGVQIKLTLEKMWDLFWGTEAGWQHKKSKRQATINWQRTIENNLKKNAVYLPKGAIDREGEQLSQNMNRRDNHEQKGSQSGTYTGTTDSDSAGATPEILGLHG
jgi:uncharacterized protein YdaU (DUF1376 family)